MLLTIFYSVRYSSYKHDFKTYSHILSLRNKYMHAQSCLTLQPYGLQPSGLLCSWDFSGKNTGVLALPSSRGSSQPRDRSFISDLSYFLGCDGQFYVLTWLATVSKYFVKYQSILSNIRDRTCISCIGRWILLPLSHLRNIFNFKQVCTLISFNCQEKRVNPWSNDLLKVI